MFVTLARECLPLRFCASALYILCATNRHTVARRLKALKQKPVKKRRVRYENAGVGFPAQVVGPASGVPIKAEVKYREFVQAYVACQGSAAAAARLSGFHTEYASDILKRPDVQIMLAEEQAEFAKRAVISREQLLEEYKRIALSNAQDYFEYSGDDIKLRPSCELTRDQMAAIAEVSQTKSKYNSKLSFKLHSKQAALDALAEMHGWRRPKADELDPTSPAIRISLKGDLMLSASGNGHNGANGNGHNGNGHASGNGNGHASDHAVVFDATLLDDPNKEPEDHE